MNKQSTQSGGGLFHHIVNIHEMVRVSGGGTMSEGRVAWKQRAIVAESLLKAVRSGAVEQPAAQSRRTLWWREIASLVPMWKERAITAEAERDAAEREIEKWIPVSDRLPASDVWCLVVCNGIVQRQCAQLVVEHDPSAERVWVWQDWEADTCPKNGLSHWRPLPDPPTQKRDYPTWADGYQVHALTPE